MHKHWRSQPPRGRGLPTATPPHANTVLPVRSPARMKSKLYQALRREDDGPHQQCQSAPGTGHLPVVYVHPSKAFHPKMKLLKTSNSQSEFMESFKQHNIIITKQQMMSPRPQTWPGKQLQGEPANRYLHMKHACSQHFIAF